MYIQKLLKCALLGGALMTAGVAYGQQADSSAVLLALLVKKGIITQAEAEQIKAEAAAQAASAPAPVYVGAAPKAVVVANTPNNGASPLSFRIGAADFTPFGFLDFTGVYRSTNTGNAIGSGFNSIPFNNTQTGQISETKFSAQNSRLGLRVDSTVGDVKVLGYVETDFLGYDNPNASTTSNSMTMRLRNYFADLRDGQWEFLAGQDWSMLTPNRKGLSPLPSDVFYSMDMDTNYQAGLTWARQAQVRAIFHANDNVTIGVSAEDPDQFVGTAVTLPAAFASGEVDTGSNGGNSIGSTAPNVIPDIIGKVAFDTKINNLPWHLEVAGLYREFKINTYGGGINATDTATGTGVSASANIMVFPGLTLVGTGFTSNGGGRYIGGLGPDFVVNPVNSAGVYTISPVKSSSVILGVEWQPVPHSQIFAYASQARFDSDYTLTGKTYTGYGYPGSASSNNRDISEYTVGEVQTVWKDPQYGALQFISQVSDVERNPWYYAAGAPNNAHATMVFFDVRYVLP